MTTPTPDRPKQPWVAALTGQAAQDHAMRVLYDATTWSEQTTAFVQTLPEFDGVPNEAVEQVVRFLVDLATDSYDERIQMGIDEKRRLAQEERDRALRSTVSRIRAMSRG
jgi:hypothetical protein